jgi:hypothetical protein
MAVAKDLSLGNCLIVHNHMLYQKGYLKRGIVKRKEFVDYLPG